MNNEETLTEKVIIATIFIAFLIVMCMMPDIL